MREELQPGDPVQVGPYRLSGVLGSGGMGRVYLGWSAGGRPVAVKVIKAELAADAEFRTRFRREVDAARTISGLYTAVLIDADPDARLPWLATAYIDAPSLAETVAAHGPLPLESVLSLAAGLAEALASIHVAGLVHRDLKPSNVLLAADGPRVIDFGLSRAADSTSLTHTGQAMGSPGFLSPEQARGDETGPASDIFSLGALLVFAASGQGPFGAGSLPALVYRVVHMPPTLDAVPAELRPLIERCLEKAPGDRPSASDLLTELAGVQPGAQWLPERITAGLPVITGSAATRADAVPDAVPGPVPAPAPSSDSATATVHRDAQVQTAAPTSRQRRGRLMAAGAGAVVVAAAVTAFALTVGNSPVGTTSGTLSQLAASGQAISSGSGTPTATPASGQSLTTQPAGTTHTAKPSATVNAPAVVITNQSTPASTKKSTPASTKKSTPAGPATTPVASTPVVSPPVASTPVVTPPVATTPVTTGPVITSVTFTGNTTTPTVTVVGSGFGALPPVGSSDNTTSCGNYTSNGEVFGPTNLWFTDVNNFTAGQGSACIGIIIDTWSANRVVYQFGNAYHSFAHWYITAGDQYQLSVLGAQYSGTAAFS